MTARCAGRRTIAPTVKSCEDLSSIPRWNTQRAKHFFCSGIYTFQRRRARAGTASVSTCSVWSISPSFVPVRATEGAGVSEVDRNARCQWPGPQEAG